MLVPEINESSIHQGDLVFILHKEKPMKTGWYRKVKYTCEGSSDTVYVFEKSVHPKFNSNDFTLANSRKERGIFLLKASTIVQAIKYGDQYEILLRVAGVSATRIVLQDYKLTQKDFEYMTLSQNNKFNSTYEYTERGLQFLNRIFAPVDPLSDVLKFAEDIMSGSSFYR